MEYTIDAEERRMIRRELINLFIHESYLQQWLPSTWNKKWLSWCKEFVREYEVNHYGQELRYEQAN